MKADAEFSRTGRATREDGAFQWDLSCCSEAGWAGDRLSGLEGGCPGKAGGKARTLSQAAEHGGWALAGGPEGVLSRGTAGLQGAASGDLWVTSTRHQWTRTKALAPPILI